MTPHRVERVGTRLRSQLQPCDGPIHPVRLLPDLPQEDIGACVDYHRNAGLVGGNTKCANKVRVLLGFAKPPALAVHSVLDIQSDSTRLDQSLDESLCRLCVAGLDIHRHRQVHRRGDLRDPGHHIVE